MDPKIEKLLADSDQVSAFTPKVTVRTQGDKTDITFRIMYDHDRKLDVYDQG